MNQQPAYTNQLVNESSLYLRQHAHNPVNWYPWGPEALARARELERPIFLSIGYSACHWCHVMEHESFEDPQIAQVLNDNFVAIKVDREERPDLDQIYMSYVQRSTGHGGWPMSVFLTPDLKPFFGGTYFPPDDRYNGRPPSFGRILAALTDAWQNRRDEIRDAARQVTEQLQESEPLEPSAGGLRVELLKNAAHWLKGAFDQTHGGFGNAPKFPHSIELRLLLRAWKRFGNDDALRMAQMTLDRMARGGMYDQLGGGFHRYSTDAHWLVPHFEKMLYDNAQLTTAYLEAYQATGSAFYRQIAQETLDYVVREMTSPEGPFYSTQDADSEGVEGKFYVWSEGEIERALGQDLAETIGYVYGVTAEGNWEEQNILHRSKTDEQDARMLRISDEELGGRLAEGKRKLLEVRGGRVWPARDEKVLTSWNGLMIGAFAQAAQVLQEPGYAETARKAADFILKQMQTPDGRLLRTWSSGTSAKLNAFLEDYSFLIDGLVSLYEATFEPRWIDAAVRLSEVMIEQFWDDAAGAFFYTGKDHEALITRTKDPHDSAIPSGNSMAVTALLRLAKLTDRKVLREKAEATLRLFGGLMEASPMAAGQMLVALDYYLGPVAEYAVVGDPGQDETRRVLALIHRGFQPNKAVALKAPGAAGAVEEAVPLLKGKSANGGVTTYICENFACQAPLVGSAALETALTT